MLLSEYVCIHLVIYYGGRSFHWISSHFVAEMLPPYVKGGYDANKEIKA